MPNCARCGRFHSEIVRPCCAADCCPAREAGQASPEAVNSEALADLAEMDADLILQEVDDERTR